MARNRTLTRHDEKVRLANKLVMSFKRELLRSLDQNDFTGEVYASCQINKGGIVTPGVKVASEFIIISDE